MCNPEIVLMASHRPTSDMRRMVRTPGTDGCRRGLPPAEAHHGHDRPFAQKQRPRR
jgi:hypothetical protein